MPALAGANLIYGAGMLELGETVSLEQIVLDNDFIAMNKEVLEGIKVTDETMASNLISKVGIGGNFIGEKHTLETMKTEQSYPIIINRKMRGAWKKEGAKDAAERAHDLVVKLLKTHTPLPIDRDLLAGMEAVIDKADKEAKESEI